MKLIVHEYDLPLKHPFTISRSTTTAQRTLIVELQQDGVSGYGEAIANKSVFFETCVDDYAELWIDGECDLAFGESGHGAVSGFNAPQRVSVSESAEPGARHVIACLAVNGPFAAPKGGIFMRYARLQFE